MQFDFLASNLQISYPFKADVVVSRPAGDVQLTPLVAALRYYTYDTREAELYVDEIDVESADGFTTLSTAVAELRWSDGTTVSLVDGTTASAAVTPYGDWIVVTWRHTVSGALPAVLHIVFPADQVTAGVPEVFRFFKKTDDIVILSSLVKQGPGKLRSIYVKRGSSLDLVAGPGEALAFGAGFNMSLESQDAVLDGGRQLTPIAINATPGAGAGRYLICTRNAYLRTLTGVQPNDNGGVKVAPEECYWVERALSSGPTAITPAHGFTNEGTLAANQLKIHNSCSPCCSCDDYVAAYNHMRAIWNRAKTVSEGFYTLRGAYNDLVARYAEIVGNISGLLTISQYLDDYMLIVVNVANITGITIPAGILITLTITPSAGSYTYTEGTGRLIGPAAKGLYPPTDPNDTPVIELDFALPTQAVETWSGMWKLSGIAAGGTIEVTATVSNGLNDSQTEILTIT